MFTHRFWVRRGHLFRNDIVGGVICVSSGGKPSPLAKHWLWFVGLTDGLRPLNHLSRYRQLRRQFRDLFARCVPCGVCVECDLLGGDGCHICNPDKS